MVASRDITNAVEVIEFVLNGGDWNLVPKLFTIEFKTRDHLVATMADIQDLFPTTSGGDPIETLVQTAACYTPRTYLPGMLADAKPGQRVALGVAAETLHPHTHDGRLQLTRVVTAIDAEGGLHQGVRIHGRKATIRSTPYQEHRTRDSGKVADALLRLAPSWLRA